MSSTPIAASAASAWTCRCPRGKEGAARTRPPLGCFPDQLPRPGTAASSASTSRTSRAVNPKIIYARGVRSARAGREAEKRRLRHDRLLVPRRHRRHHHPAGIEGMIGPPGPAYATPSPAPIWPAASRRRCSRERAGEPSVVDVSLLGSGLWAMGHTIALTQHLQRATGGARPRVHGSPINPLVGLYETADGRYISFVMMQPTVLGRRVRHMDVTGIDDPRFASAEQIAAHTADAVEIPGKAMATRTPGGVVGPLRHPGRTVGAGAGHTAGGRRCPGAGQRLLGAGRRTGLVSNRFDVAAPFRGRARLRRADRRILEELRIGLGPDHRAQDRQRGHLTGAPEISCATPPSLGPAEPPRGLTSERNDRGLHSILPSGRYFTQTSATGEHVSRSSSGNEPQPLPNSKCD